MPSFDTETTTDGTMVFALENNGSVGSFIAASNRPIEIVRRRRIYLSRSSTWVSQADISKAQLFPNAEMALNMANSQQAIQNLPANYL